MVLYGPGGGWVAKERTPLKALGGVGDGNFKGGQLAPKARGYVSKKRVKNVNATLNTSLTFASQHNLKQPFYAVKAVLLKQDMVLIKLFLSMIPCTENMLNLFIGGCRDNERGQTDTGATTYRAKFLA